MTENTNESGYGQYLTPLYPVPAAEPFPAEIAGTLDGVFAAATGTTKLGESADRITATFGTLPECVTNYQVGPTTSWATFSSDLIVRAHYEPAREQMVLELKTSTKARGEEMKCYRYVEFSVAAWHAFLLAESAGAHYNAEIKGRYPSMPHPGFPTH